jgi:hypothetical protein
VKPLPHYLTSHSFWRKYLQSDADPVREVRRAMLGYLRTYAYLVQSESDFRVAQEPRLQLIAAGVTWEQFCDFAMHLASVENNDVSERYAYGEIQLTRLSFYAPLLLGKSYYQRVEYQYGAYFARFYAPVLFVIGIVSIVLNALQVIVSANQVTPMRNGEVLLSVALWFRVVMILFFWTVLIFLSALLIYKLQWSGNKLFATASGS